MHWVCGLGAGRSWGNVVSRFRRLPGRSVVTAPFKPIATLCRLRKSLASFHRPLDLPYDPFGLFVAELAEEFQAPCKQFNRPGWQNFGIVV